MNKYTPIRDGAFHIRVIDSMMFVRASDGRLAGAVDVASIARTAPQKGSFVASCISRARKLANVRTNSRSAPRVVRD